MCYMYLYWLILLKYRDFWILWIYFTQKEAFWEYLEIDPGCGKSYNSGSFIIVESGLERHTGSRAVFVYLYLSR